MHQQPRQSIAMAPIHQRQKFLQKAKQNPNFNIIKSIDQVELKCKRGVNSPRIHIVSLFHHMPQYHKHYAISPETLQELEQIFLSYPNLKIQQIRDADYFKLAYVKLDKILKGKGKKQLARGKKSINTDELEEVFADVQGKYQDTDKMIDFIVNRMNAKVLELIYRKHLIDIFFGPGSKKFEDRLTNMLFVAEYRSRLPNPLLCKHIQCVRPNIKQKAYRKKDTSQKSEGSMKESQTAQKRTRTRKPNNSGNSLTKTTSLIEKKPSFYQQKTDQKIQINSKKDDYFFVQIEESQYQQNESERGVIDINELYESENEKFRNQRPQKKTKPIKKGNK